MLNPVDQREQLYLDYAATAPVHPRAAAALARGQHLIGNPSSSHGAGREAAEALAEARNTVAHLFAVASEEVVFTSGGSEANALALWGTLAARGFRGHVVSSAIEHPAVLENLRALGELGVAVTLVPPDPSGHVTADAIERALREDTVLVSVMHANNETGAIQPVEQIAALTQRRGIPFHTDAVHTAGKLDLTALGATLISVSAHKFGGPRGVGALAVRAGHRLLPLVYGGGQENGLRAGTENVAGALGMAAAVEAYRERSSEARRAAHGLRNQLVTGLLAIGDAQVSASDPVVAETVSIRFAGIRAEAVADELDMHGICVSTGSACHTGSDAVSHVLTAMGIPEREARATLRFSFGSGTSAADIERVVEVTARSVHRLRKVVGRMGSVGGRR